MVTVKMARAAPTRSTEVSTAEAHVRQHPIIANTSTTMLVFLSHNSQDKGAAETIAHGLNLQGIEVWLDKWEILAGESLTDRIEDGLHTASAFVILMSPRSMNSRWVREELRIALQKRIKSDDFRIVPILLEDCEIPLFLIDYRWIDWRSGWTPQGMEDLVLTIKRIRPKPSIAPETVEPKIEFRDVVYEVELFGPRAEQAVFTETLSAHALSEIAQIDRQIDPCGILRDVKSDRFNIVRKAVSGRIERWVLKPVDQISTGTEFQYAVQYAIDGAFPDGQRSWTYSIEAPTEKLTVRFDFSRSVLPSQFSVSHRIGQSLFPEPTPPQLAGSVYVWTKLLPTYKDTYEFAFEWGA